MYLRSNRTLTLEKQNRKISMSHEETAVDILA